MNASTLLRGILVLTPKTIAWGTGAGVLAFPAKVSLDELLYKAGASSWDVMLVNAGITALFAATLLIILLNWVRHSRSKQMEHVRHLYAASDRIRNELQTLVYGTALTAHDKEVVRMMFKATEDIVKELDQMVPCAGIAEEVRFAENKIPRLMRRFSFRRHSGVDLGQQ
jgi:hypothetical protein